MDWLVLPAIFLLLWVWHVGDSLKFLNLPSITWSRDEDRLLSWALSRRLQIHSSRILLGISKKLCCPCDGWRYFLAKVLLIVLILVNDFCFCAILLSFLLQIILRLILLVLQPILELQSSTCWSKQHQWNLICPEASLILIILLLRRRQSLFLTFWPLSPFAPKTCVCAYRWGIWRRGHFSSPCLQRVCGPYKDWWWVLPMRIVMLLGLVKAIQWNWTSQRERSFSQLSAARFMQVD